MSLKAKFIKKHNNLITGIEEIDAQHHDLFEAIQKLEYPNKSRKDLWDILMRIEIYACTHFDTEAKYMEKFCYPSIEEHKKEHDDFVIKFSELKIKFEQEGFTEEFVEDLQNFLIIWICKHYRTTDIQMSEFIKKRLELIGLYE